MAAINVVPSESADPRALIDACRIEISEADNHRDPDATGGPFEYYIEMIGPSDQSLKSHAFNVNALGEHVWYTPIFDESGEWTINLVDGADDSVVETASQTVS